MSRVGRAPLNVDIIMRTIKHNEAAREIDSYEHRHRPTSQNQPIQGVYVNPVLRAFFDSTPNDDRELLEIEDWWGKPYVTTQEWNADHEHWQYHCDRCAEASLDTGTEEDFKFRIKQQKALWYASWPSGVKFTLRCLDGGAWDRSTVWGTFATLEEAVDFAKNKKLPQYTRDIYEQIISDNF